METNSAWVPELAFEVQPQTSSPKFNLSTFEPNFSFCSFNEGHDQSSLDAMKSKYNAWLEETNDDNTEPYAYVMLEPQESTESVDFVWLDLF